MMTESRAKRLRIDAGERHAPPLVPSWFETTLVLAPHCDDEAFCGGLIHRLSAAGSRVHIAVAVVNDGRSRDRGREVGHGERLEELRRSAAHLGVPAERLHVGVASPGTRLDEVPLSRVVGWLDGLLADLRPSAVLFPYRSHHQDHQRVHDAAVAALRHRPSSSVRLEALWEYPYILVDPWKQESSHLGWLTVDITGGPMQAKLRALEAHRSQVDGAERGSMVSADAVRALGAARGLETGTEHAERYYILKSKLF